MDEWLKSPPHGNPMGSLGYLSCLPWLPETWQLRKRGLTLACNFLPAMLLPTVELDGEGECSACIRDLLYTLSS